MVIATLAGAPLAQAAPEARVDLVFGLAPHNTSVQDHSYPWGTGSLGFLAAAQFEGPFVGGHLDLTSTLFEHAELFCGGTVGWELALGPLGLTAAADGGLHLVWDVGEGLFKTTVSSPTVALPFVGARLGVDRLGGGALRRIGIWLTGRVDLAHTRTTVRYSSSGCWLSSFAPCDGRTTYSEQDFFVGGAQLGVTLHLGFGK